MALSDETTVKTHQKGFRKAFDRVGDRKLLSFFCWSTERPGHPPSTLCSAPMPQKGFYAQSGPFGPIVTHFCLHPPISQQ